ncbi:MAG: hypothetical protein AAF992_22020, partial [Bacteroidota bacterium]
VNLARLPRTKTKVFIGDFRQIIEKAPLADLNVFGMGDEPDFDFFEKMTIQTQSTCLFVKNSGHESILA